MLCNQSEESFFDQWAPPLYSPTALIQSKEAEMSRQCNAKIRWSLESTVSLMMSSIHSARKRWLERGPIHSWRYQKFDQWNYATLLKQTINDMIDSNAKPKKKFDENEKLKIECLRTGFTSAGFTSKKMKKTETGCKFRRRKSCLRKKIGVRFRNFISGRRTLIFFGGRPGVNRFTRESEKDVNPEHESRR